MKKILALVLVMTVSVMAATVDFNVASSNATTVTVAYTGTVVGMAMNVDCTGTLAVTAVAMPAFLDVYMDDAYDQGTAYNYELRASGNPVALQGQAGATSLTTDGQAFCISAGGLVDLVGDEAPASGTITLTVTGEGTLTISPNTLRGGVVDYDGAMDITYTSASVTISAIPTVCKGNMNADTVVNDEDITLLVLLLAQGEELYFPGSGIYEMASTNPNFSAAGDINNDNVINDEDVTLAVLLLASGEELYFPGSGIYELSCN